MNELISQSVPSRVADSDTYDGAVTQLIQVQNGDILLFYHESDIGHMAPDGRVVMRRSVDRGKTWTQPQTIHDEPDRDITDPSVVYCPESGRISLFDVAAGFSEPIESPDDLDSKPSRENFDTYLVKSLDHGRTWTSPRRITDQVSGEHVVPFGGGERTTQGLISCFYSDGWDLQALFSTDDGETWDRHTFIGESPRGRKLCEPVPCAITESNLLLYGRDNATGDFFVMKSQDGGKTWNGPVFFNPTDSKSPKPIWVKKTGPDRVTAVWGDRDDLFIYAVNTSAQLAWENPAAFVHEPKMRIHQHVGSSESASYWGGDAGDFGYPTCTKINEFESQIIISFYDGIGYPDIWCTVFPSMRID